MEADPLSGFPPRPSDVAEWEELLLRFELAPRAVKHTLDEAAPGEAPAAVAGELARLARREAEAAGWLRAFAEGGRLEPLTDPAGAEESLDAGAALARFAQLRARNFGWVQRRGLEVWGWAAEHPEHGTVTAFQLLSALVRGDGEHLARLRAQRASPC